MRIAVVGTGYVGLVSGTCFAEFGIDVVCIDKDACKIKALKKGLQALDHPKLIGVVINEAPRMDEVNYDGQYYGATKPRRGAVQNHEPGSAA